MKKLAALLIISSLFVTSVFSGVASAATIYIPTSSSSQYLPTVKILSYSSKNEFLTPEGWGSGTLIDDRGTILTNKHVVMSAFDQTQFNDAFQICLTKSNNTENPICEFTASLIATDPDRDLALLRIDPKDARGNTVNFNFSLPYENSGSPEVSDKITVIGFPDTGGKTITYTSGLVSGFLTEAGVKYIKTDADISFGNSGGSAVDADGNLIGIPTFINASVGGSSEVLGYLFPVKEAVTWIKSHISDSLTVNEVAGAELKKAIKANIEANDSGKYKNDYPPYEISLTDGWKFGNSLEGAFDSSGYGASYGTDTVVIYPSTTSETSQLFISVSVTDYAYEVTLDDVEYVINTYANTYLFTSPILERVNFNGKYESIKETSTYTDWWTGLNSTTITYYIPYGDKVINVLYNYGDSDTAKLSQAEKILDTFSVDIKKIQSSVVDKVTSKKLNITVKNPLKDAFLSDDSYSYDGADYFAASFGKKRDYNFLISIYSNFHWGDFIGDFKGFKKQTLADADSFYDLVAKGNVKIDGHEGFFYTDQYDDGFGNTTFYTTVFVDNGDDTYLTVYYSGPEDSYKANAKDFKKVLKNIQLDNEGKGKYTVPSFLTSPAAGGTILGDIKNHLYENNIKNLKKLGAFGENAPVTFGPQDALTRKSFVLWSVKTLGGSALTEFTTYKDGYKSCTKDCFSDVPEDENAVYINYALSKGALSGAKFNPEEQITVAAAIKIAAKLYSYEVWQAPEFLPWYLPYLHLGYKLGVMPYGVDEPLYKLNRAEGAFLIDMFVSMNSSWNAEPWKF